MEDTLTYDKKLFLLDAYALIYRAYYALIRSPRVTSQGFNTSAIFGFVNTLEEVLKKESPTHMAVCFDPAGPTFRHEEYPEYKAQRDKQPEDITRSVPVIKDIIRAYGIPVVEVAGFEADDVIGTLARRAEGEGFITYMMTPDKDYGQLVTDRVLQYKPSMRGADAEIRGPREVCERYGISSTAQVIDLLALEGDAVDNIPGCPGVGEKTAVKLISEWQSVENLLANTASIKGALQRKLADNADKIIFSKYLATIRTDVPMDVAIDSLRVGAPDKARLAALYAELEFRTFLRRLQGDDASVGAPAPVRPAEGQPLSLFDDVQDADTTPPAVIDRSAVSYTVAGTAAQVSAAVADALGRGCAGVAMYAVGAEDMTARWMGVAIASEPGRAVYIPLPDFADERAAVADALRPLFARGSGCRIASHDVKRDMLLLRRHGIEYGADYFDTAIAHYLLEPEMNHSLARVAASVLRYDMIELTEGSERARRRGEALPAADAAVRVCEMADVTLRLVGPLTEAVGADSALMKLMETVEFPLAKVLASMEYEGVCIDTSVLAALSRKLSERLHGMEQEAYALAGGEFNIASPSQVGEVLFGRLKLDPKAKRTKTGGYSTTEEILDKYRDAHPLVGLILDIRGLRKLLTTYIDALPSLVNPATGRIHTTYNQTVTATGRISSANPNLQNIPVRTDDGREIRRAFIPSEGHVMLSADYSQIELRVIADMSGDPDMIEAFRSNADIHQSTAAKIYHEALENVTAEQRRRAKTANFGIIYGISAFGLAQRLHIPRYEAKELIDGYFRTYPHIREYTEKAIATAREQGYVATIMGRKRMLPDINSRSAVMRGYAERNAVNAPIQGSAADIIKVAMVRVAEELERQGLRSKMIMQVHDELILDVVAEETDRVAALVKECMTDAYHGRVPLEVSAGIGANWLEAH